MSDTQGVGRAAIVGFTVAMEGMVVVVVVVVVVEVVVDGFSCEDDAF